jgi:hypothetical protein
MPSSQDFFDRMGEIRDRLTDVNTKLQKLDQNTDEVEPRLLDVRNAVQQVNGTLAFGFTQLIALGTYTNQALAHNAKQNDTIICILEHISENTCDLVNEAHKQTAYQQTIAEATRTLADLYEATHAEAALGRQKLEALRRQIEECCPPPRPEPPCRYERCEAPDRLPPPPRVETPPQPPRPRRPEG